jgi:hypothetical protein
VKKLLTRVFIAGLVLFAALQVIPVDRSNPPVTRNVDAPPRVAAILRTSCYDCHSNEVRRPFYAYIAPVSWLVADDVKKGRALLNFSRWDRYSREKQDTLRGRCYDLASENLMPLPTYLIMHRDARLDSEKIEEIRKWSEGGL